MTIVPFPTAPTEPPGLRLPIASITTPDGTAHHMHPATGEITLCGTPYGEEAMIGPYDRDVIELQPITCEGCEQAVWYAQSLLAAHAKQPADPVGLRWSAGAALAAAWTLDGITAPHPDDDLEASS